MAYTVEFKPSAARAYSKLPEAVRERLAPKIESLETTPHPRGSEKLAGLDDIWRIRVGDYRVVYQIRQSALVILVVAIGHRREVYRG